jgi:hypothetical protein
MFRKYRKTKTIDEETINSESKIKKISSILPKRFRKNDEKSLFAQSSFEPTSKKKDMVDLTSKSSSAESTLVLKGQKYSSAIALIKIKNYSSLNENARKLLTDILEKNKDKGLIEWKEDSVNMIFTPLETRTYHNEMLATKVAFNILRDFNDFNRKYSSKIDFNIGVNSGELVVSRAGGKLQYTAMGNTISLAKKIADSD